MPRTDREGPAWLASARRELWAGSGTGWTMVSDLVAGTFIWGAIGFGLDRWLGTGPTLMVIGAVVGHIAAIVLVIRKGTRMSIEAGKRKRQGSNG